MRNGLLVFAAGLSAICNASLLAQTAERSPDYLVKSYAVTGVSPLEETDLKFLTAMACTKEPFKSGIPSILSGPNSIIVHRATWTQKSGLYALLSSDWYLYERKLNKSGCSLDQIRLKADGSLALYAKKSAWLLAFNNFTTPIDPRSVSILYKISATPDIPQNIQDLGALIAGLLGATLPGAKAGAGLALAVAPAPPPPTNTLITLAKVSGDQKTPFFFNIGLQFSLLPSAAPAVGRVGAPYSTSLYPVGGSGNYTFSTVYGSLPAGLSLNTSTGLISGTPVQKGAATFTVEVKDDGSPAKIGVSDFTIVVNDSVDIPQKKTTPAKLSTFVGDYYSADLRSSGAAGPVVFQVSKGTLPEGLSLDSVTGTISGIPRNVEKSPVTIEADDDKGKQAGYLDATIDIGPTDSINIAVGGRLKLPHALAGVPYRATIAIAAATGKEEIAVMKSASDCNNMKADEDENGALPRGLTRADLGGGLQAIDGIPPYAGKTEFQLCARAGAASKPVSHRFELNVLSGTLALTSSAPADNSQTGGNKGDNTGPGGGNQGKGKGQGQNQAQNQSTDNSGNTPQQTSGATPVDCSSITAGAPCSLTRRIRSDDREWFDFSIGVSVPGVRERTYAGNNPASPSITTHTDLLGVVNIYPFARWANNESWLPHVDAGLPVTSQPFYRPFVALGDTLTTWTGAERRGFPLRISVFAGLVDMKQQIVVNNAVSHDRAWKPIYGVEVSVSALVSKIGGGKSQSQGGKGGKGGGGG